MTGVGIDVGKASLELAVDGAPPRILYGTSASLNCLRFASALSLPPGVRGPVLQSA